jgi:hypothetical protein
MAYHKLAVRALLLVVCLAALASRAQAQYRTSIQGVVTDPSGAVVSGATLTLTNPATNETQTRVSNDSGVFNFNALPASVKFRLEATAKGFQKKVIENLELTPDQANSVTVQLQVGTATQTVTVNGDTVPALDTETANISGTVSSNQIQHMPSFGRDVFQLLQLAPGVFGDGAQGSGGGSQSIPGTQGPGATGGNTGIFATENGPQILAAGQQYENNGISIDGVSTASAVWGGTTVITPSEDSVESVKVLSNGYDAENGRFSGAQVEVTTKSGTNDFHGSAFYTAHRPGLNAYQRFNGGYEGTNNPVEKDTNLFNQYGGGIGGPIWKNKVFFYFNYETQREPHSPGTSTGWYETSAFDAAAPAGSIASKYLNFPGNAINGTVVPSTCAEAGLVDAAHVSMMQPTPNCAEVAGGLDIGSPIKTGLGNQDLSWDSPSNPGLGGGFDGIADIADYSTTSNTTSTSNQYAGRIDADVTSKDRLSYTMYYVPQSSTFLNGAPREYNLFHHSQINEDFGGIWNHTFSPTMLNEARVNAAGWRWNEVDDNPQSPVGLPSDYIGTIGTVNLGSFGPNVGSILDQWTYGFKDVATKIVGNNTIKFGGELTRLFYLNDCAGCGVPSYQFFNLWDFLNDAPHNESSNFNPFTGVPTTFRQDDREDLLGLFVQDDYKLRRNLTINFGLRFSHFGPLSSKEHNMFQALPGSGADFLTGLVVRPHHSWNAESNLGPQIGMAWSPDLFRGKLVVRGGFGLNYNQEEIAISANINENPGLTVSPNFGFSTANGSNPNIIYAVSSNIHSIYGYPANPNTVSTFSANGLPATANYATGTGANVSIFPTDLPTMHVYHYSLDTQYDLGHDLVASVGYQGSKSYDLYFHENPTAYAASMGYALNPQIGGGDYWSNLGSGNYNAMLLGLQHHFAHQFMADAEFTWAKSMDDSSAPYSEQIYPYDPSLNYGRSDYNVGKAFKLYGLWQPVFFHGSNSWVEKIAGGWSLSGIFNIHSGFPWTPVYNIPGSGAPGTYGNLYYANSGYSQLLPAAYLGGAGSSTSNNQFKSGANYPNGGLAYFSIPNYTAYSGVDYGTALPETGVRRNSLTGPGYRDVDMTLSKAFGLPRIPGLGEGAKFEFRMDAYNVFNNLNFNPTSIINDITAAGFGRAQSALAARVVTLGARFSF